MDTISLKAQKVKLFILDVDGILTNGHIYYGNDQSELKGFHVHDGLGLVVLQKCGIEIAIISSKNSDAVSRRLADLNIQHVYLGQKNKLIAYNQLKEKLNLSDEEIAYMGDDLPDLALLKRVGFAITVPPAPLSIQQAVDFITNKLPGHGAVREVCDLILASQGRYDSVIECYSQNGDL